ncbi:MAG: polysaccharide biosynthesis protein [Lachnospiraceae bacterium]|nr:polysaccharide biosynthesis protein [Lachnospiraceae bacterium]
MNKNRVLKNIISVSGIVILAKILGFVKQMITAGYFGATIQTDLISLSEGLVSNIDYLLIHALATAFIPTYIAIGMDEPEKRKKFVENTISVFLIITLAISSVLFIAAPVVARILAPSYDASLSVRLAGYIRIFAPVIIIIVELAVFNALLKANEQFIPGEFVSCNQSIILILLVLAIGSKVGPDTLVIGFYTYAAINLIFLMICSRKYWSIRFSVAFSDPDVKKLLIMMGPLLLGYSMVFVNQQVDKIIVSGLGEGTVTAMSYAAVLSNFIGTFVGSICGVLFTYVTQCVTEKKEPEAAALVTASSVQFMTLLLPVSILTVANASDIVTIVFGHGKFNASAVAQCAIALAGYGCMFVPLVLREQFSRFQYAYGDSRQPMINSAIAIVFNIIFSILLSRWLGVLGVTLATSISVLICSALNVRSSLHRNQHLKLRDFLKCVPQWLAGVAICLGMTLLGHRFLSGAHPAIRFLSITAVSFMLYGIIAWPILKPLAARLRK